jgi:voltage-gated potassium channel
VRRRAAWLLAVDDVVVGMVEFQAAPTALRRRLVVAGLLRASAVTVVLVALYYVVPLDGMVDTSLWITLGGCLVLLAIATVLQVRAVLRSSRPGVRAVEGLASTVPLFLLLFAAAYYLLAQSSATNFNVGGLTRTDALYFTVTVFTTVGFGDITATSQLTRGVVTVQMLLDLIVLGLVIRVFFGAVQTAWRHKAEAGTDAG